MEWKLTQNRVKFTQSYSIISKFTLFRVRFYSFYRAIPFFTPYFLQCTFVVVNYAPFIKMQLVKTHPTQSVSPWLESIITLNQNWVHFVHYLKVSNTFLTKSMYPEQNCLRNSKMPLEFLSTNNWRHSCKNTHVRSKNIKFFLLFVCFMFYDFKILFKVVDFCANLDLRERSIFKSTNGQIGLSSILRLSSCKVII